LIQQLDTRLWLLVVGVGMVVVVVAVVVVVVVVVMVVVTAVEALLGDRRRINININNRTFKL
jgi:hypothetical protein